MSTFELDTSGIVYGHGDRGHDKDVGYKAWGNLAPFPQGYIEAALRSLRAKWTETPRVPLQGPAARIEIERIGFRHLAPETVAAILKDCASFSAIVAPTHENGAMFWEQRQRGVHGTEYPPLTPYLGDDGRVYLREAA